MTENETLYILLYESSRKTLTKIWGEKQLFPLNYFINTALRILQRNLEKLAHSLKKIICQVALMYSFIKYFILFSEI